MPQHVHIDDFAVYRGSGVGIRRIHTGEVANCILRIVRVDASGYSQYADPKKNMQPTLILALYSETLSYLLTVS